jgi:hypothetical protein
METHFNVQRRLFDYQFSLTTTPGEFERVHQTFIETYNNSSCHLEIHEHLRSNLWVEITNTPGEEHAHGRKDYSDVLPVRRSFEDDAASGRLPM